MNIEEFNDELKTGAFEYFYWFSRFEFALKENEYVRKGRFMEALPDWKKFKDKYATEFIETSEFLSLKDAPPKYQELREGSCVWAVLNIEREEADLGKALLILKTIRNNLFHGGKHNHSDWDDPRRNLFLLTNGKRLLDHLALSSDLASDYARVY